MDSIIKRSCFFVSEYLLITISAASAVLALLFAYLKSRQVIKAPEGTPLMQKISLAVRTGALAYLKRQYRVVIVIFTASQHPYQADCSAHIYPRETISTV